MLSKKRFDRDDEKDSGNMDLSFAVINSLIKYPCDSNSLFREGVQYLTDQIFCSESE